MTPDELRSARERAGLSQYELADKLGVHGRTVGNWERGTTAIPRGKTHDLTQLLADYLPTGDETQSLKGSSDAELLAEIARRFNRKGALQAREHLAEELFGEPQAARTFRVAPGNPDVQQADADAEAGDPEGPEEGA